MGGPSELAPDARDATPSRGYGCSNAAATRSAIPARTFVLVGDVLVQRHRLDAEALAETAHRERTQAVAVGKLDGGIEDPVAIERHAWLGFPNWIVRA